MIRSRKLCPLAFFAFLQKVITESARNKKQTPFKVGVHERPLSEPMNNS